MKMLGHLLPRVFLLSCLVMLNGCCHLFPRLSQCPPKAAISPTSLDFGELTNSLTFRVTNDGGGALNWRASSNAAWIGFSQAQGVLRPGVFLDVAVSVDRGPLEGGTHTGEIRVASESGTSVIAVSVKKPTKTLVIDKVHVDQTPQTGDWLMCFMATTQSGSSATYNVPYYKYRGVVDIQMNLELPNIHEGEVVSFRMQLDNDQDHVCGNASDYGNDTFAASASGSKAFNLGSGAHPFTIVLYWHIR
jgi:hypothetical protein